MNDNPQFNRRGLLQATGAATAAGMLSATAQGKDKDDDRKKRIANIRPPLKIKPDKLSQELLNAIRIPPRVNHQPFPA